MSNRSDRARRRAAQLRTRRILLVVLVLIILAAIVLAFVLRNGVQPASLLLQAGWQLAQAFCVTVAAG